jgi:EAL domain-containing protein (putative c-di-GMP-specific phosphodiesterase class I)
LISSFAECLAKCKIAPEQLELELTESVLMETSQKYREAFDRLRKLGVRLSIGRFQHRVFGA